MSLQGFLLQEMTRLRVIIGALSNYKQMSDYLREKEIESIHRYLFKLELGVKKAASSREISTKKSQHLEVPRSWEIQSGLLPSLHIEIYLSH